MAKKQAKEEKRRRQPQGGSELPPTLGTTEEISMDMLEDRREESKFVWHKKYQDLESKGVSRDSVLRQEASMRRENEVELEKVRRAREERERVREMLRSDQDDQGQTKDDELFSKWVSEEDKFLFEQAKRRSEIRMKEGRGKPIDQLSIYVYGTTEPIAQSIQLPFAIFSTLSTRDLSELITDMREFQRMEQSPSAEQFWMDMLTVAEHEYKEKRAEAARSDPTISAAERRALESGITDQVRGSVMNILRGKSVAELDTLEAEIRKRMGTGNAFDDATYWTALLDELHPQRARARLRAAHPARVQAALTGVPAIDAAGPSCARPPPSAASASATVSAVHGATHGEGAGGNGSTAAAAAARAEFGPDSPVMSAQLDARDRSFSPELVALSAVPEDAIVVEEADDAHMLRLARDDVLNRLRSGRLKHLAPPSTAAATAESKAAETEHADNPDGGAGGAAVRGGLVAVGTVVRTGAALDDSERAVQMFRAEEQRGDGENEEPFNEDYGLGHVTYSWASRHTPRKPRFYNRVMSGFEWNQYNRTHYDVENLPPKIIQGYKFNIFYPELANRENTPTYTLRALPEDPEYAVLRFTAGPPYEDVAFKVLNLPWLHSRRAGYRCQFDRTNCFQLYFFLRRERYRR
jgi:hypothetical protein